MKDKNIIKRLLIPRRSKSYAYRMGFDCAKNGANTKNCHFSIFASPEGKEEWEKGHKAGKAALAHK